MVKSANEFRGGAGGFDFSPLEVGNGPDLKGQSPTVKRNREASKLKARRQEIAKDVNRDRMDSEKPPLQRLSEKGTEARPSTLPGERFVGHFRACATNHPHTVCGALGQKLWTNHPVFMEGLEKRSQERKLARVAKALKEAGNLETAKPTKIAKVRRAAAQARVQIPPAVLQNPDERKSESD